MTVRYMPHMPELQGVSGKARYEGGTLHFDIASGTAVGLGRPAPPSTSPGSTGRRRSTPRIRMPITGSAQDVIRFLARPKLGLPQGRALRLPGGWAATWRSTCRSAFRCSMRLPSPTRPQGRGGAVALLAEGRDRRRRPHRRHGARQVRQLGAHRHRHGQARRQRRGDRLARAVRRRGAVPPRYELKGTVPRR